MSTFPSPPSLERLEELRVEFVSSFNNTLSKVDIDAFLDFWRKCRLPITVACGTLACMLLATKTWKKASERLRRHRLQTLVDEKRTRRAAGIDELHKKLELEATAKVLAKRREVVLLKFDQLSQRLQNGTLTAVEVLKAYQWRALEAHAQTNCVCHFIPEASTWAASLDAQYSANSGSQQKPPLFGVPISVCEAYELVDHDCTLGFVSFLDQPSKRDAVLVSTLKQMGAVPFVVTNVSQGLLSVGCSNPLFGNTTNPNDPMRSAGGACGGEAALIAMLGSPGGIGVDQPGGGMAVPAHWCGVCSLKPTSRRLSNAGTRKVTSGPGAVGLIGPSGPGAVGLIGPNVGSVVSMMRAVCSPSSLMYHADPYTVPLAFNDDLYKDPRPLTIGYYHSDGVLTPIPACTRAVDTARRILEAKGHLLVQIPLPFNSDEMRDMVAAYIAVSMPDAGQSISELYKQDLVDPTNYGFVQFLSISQNRRRQLSKRAPSKRLQKILHPFTNSVSEQESIWSKIRTFRSRFVHFCSERKLDCIICPVMASTPLQAGEVEKMHYLLWWHSAMYSILDFPSGVVRCTTVTISDERAAMNGRDEIEEDWVSRGIRSAAEGTVGMPLGVQCVSLPFREEMCLRIMKDIESGARK